MAVGSCNIYKGLRRMGSCSTDQSLGRESSRILRTDVLVTETVSKRDCKGLAALCWGCRGIPCFFSPSRRLRRRTKKGKRVFRGHPYYLRFIIPLLPAPQAGCPAEGGCPLHSRFWNLCSQSS